MTEEELRKKIGKENPFRVPEGYFEGFADNMMRLLPEREFKEQAPAVQPVIRRKTWRPWLYAAAAVCAVAFIVGAVHRADIRPSDEPLAQYTEEEMADYMATSLFDEYTLYCYLTDEE